MRRKTFTLTFASLMAALSFTFMYLGTLTGVLDMTACAVCSALTLILYRECGRSAAVCATAVCGVLCFILLPDKISAVLYVTVGAVYPLFHVFARRLNRTPAWCLKCTAAVLIIMAYVGATFLFIPAEATVKMIAPALLLGLPCFIMLDVLLSRLMPVYEFRIRQYIVRYRR